MAISGLMQGKAVTNLGLCIVLDIIGLSITQEKLDEWDVGWRICEIKVKFYQFIKRTVIILVYFI